MELQILWIGSQDGALMELAIGPDCGVLFDENGDRLAVMEGVKMVLNDLQI